MLILEALNAVIADKIVLDKAERENEALEAVVGDKIALDKAERE